jgi:hypothetical protein
MPIQLRTDTSAAEHNLRKSWPFAPNPVHFADCTRFLRTTGYCSYLGSANVHSCPVSRYSPISARDIMSLKEE